jgi:L-erythro-3,5-diaminohexanoate dehydrogenase
VPGVRGGALSALAFTGLDPGRLGVHRSLDPRGALPHIARVVDASAPINEHEVEIDVEMLAVDATSFAEIRRRSRSDPVAIAHAIQTIVDERGKLQNPWTGSGGVAMGRVRRVGSAYQMDDLAPGELAVPLASLIAIPLALTAVGPVAPDSPHVPVRGRAIVTGGMLCARVPRDLPAALALTAFDVYPAASYIRELAREGDHVLVLGAGHAGLLAVAAAGAAVGACGVVTAVDVSADALERAALVAPAAKTVQADVTDPVAVAGALAARGIRPADLTLQCTSVDGAEGTALLATAPRGTVIFFSTATRFAAAALGADAIGSQARLVIPNGLTDDRGEYALELLRRVMPLRAAYGERS